LWQKRWPSDKANHSCDNKYLTVVHNQIRRSFDSALKQCIIQQTSILKQGFTVNGESFTGLNFRGFDPMKYFAEILLRFIGQECSQL